MTIDYTILLIILWILFAFLSNDNSSIRRVVVILLCLIFIMQSGLRDYIHTINDTQNYFIWFESIKEENINTIISSFSLSYDNYESRDPGFTLFTKLFQFISLDFRAYLVFVASIISIPLCRILYKYIPSINGLFMAAVIYQSLFAGFFDTGVRQTIALGICLFSMISYERRKIVPHYLLILIAYTIHASAILFAPLYLIRNVDPKKVLYVSLLLTPITMYFAPSIVAYLGAGTIYESYAVNSTDNLGTPVFTTMIALITIATAINYNRITLYFKESIFLIQGMAIALMLTPASWVDSNFLRITYYYLIFLLPLYPMMIEAVTMRQPRIRNLVYVASALALLILKYH